MTIIDTSISRRALLGGIACAAVPAAAGASEIQIAGSEHPKARVRRLTEELSDALNFYENGRWGAKVYPSNVYSYPIIIDVIPDFADARWRLSVAMAEAKKALFDITGTWPVDASRVDDQHSVVAFGVLPEHRTELKWYYEDDEPLFADDVVRS